MATRIRATVAVAVEERRYSQAEIAELTGLPAEAIAELARADLLPTVTKTEPRFTARSLAIARRARRLRRGFELDDAGLVLALTLIERIETLEQRLRELECQLPR